MTDQFHSCDITPTGISVKVLRDGVGHRTAIGVKDYAASSDFIAAVTNLLTATLGKDLALVVANIAAREDDKAATIDALTAQHQEQVAALEADIAILGTKEEALAIRKAQARANDLKLLAEVTARLRVDEHAEPEPADVKL